MKFKLLLAAFLLCAASAFAQGTIRFDLGDSTFHATLTLDAALVHPNSELWPSDGYTVAATGLTVTSPDHAWADDGAIRTVWGIFSGFDADGKLHVNTYASAGASAAGRELLINGGIGGYAEMKEIDSTTRQLLYYASGPWQVTIVPEPSTFALLGLGLLALYMKRAANR